MLRFQQHCVGIIVLSVSISQSTPSLVPQVCVCAFECVHAIMPLLLDPSGSTKEATALGHGLEKKVIDSLIIAL